LSCFVTKAFFEGKKKKKNKKIEKASARVRTRELSVTKQVTYPLHHNGR